MPTAAGARAILSSPCEAFEQLPPGWRFRGTSSASCGAWSSRPRPSSIHCAKGSSSTLSRFNHANVTPGLLRLLSGDSRRGDAGEFSAGARDTNGWLLLHALWHSDGRSVADGGLDPTNRAGSILPPRRRGDGTQSQLREAAAVGRSFGKGARSEERRVGKECRSRACPCPEK